MTKERAVKLIVDLFADFSRGDYSRVTPEEVAEKIYKQVILKAIEDERERLVSMLAAGGRGFDS